jgi:serine protease Do
VAIAKVRSANCKPGIRSLLLVICALQLAVTLPAYAQDNAEASLETREEVALKAAADAVAPSVVQLRTIGGLDSVEGTVLADGPTTGIVISPDGYIISSAFNFAQQPASIIITFASGKQAPAELVATDHSRMLVLLKANGVADLPVPTMAPLAEIRPGQWAVTVGRTFRADKTNVTVGIVSAVGRMFGKAIQTDADVSLANYGGPLVDIRGRVLGVIVPMAPQGTSEMAGTEWYDSGIGFAVPLTGMSDRIEKMKKGDDQRPGLLGIGMAPKNSHSSPAELAAVRPDAPAGQAGLKKGDRIIELNGKPIKTQIDLRFALGTAYGGDEVRVVAMRGKERIERTIKLAGELPPFRHAFLGLLPLRPDTLSVAADKKPNDGQKTEDGNDDTKDSGTADDKKSQPTEKGVATRMVYDGSPAAEAGIQIGDRITNINESKTASIDDAITAVNSLAPGNKVGVKLTRGSETKEITLTAARLPTNIPGELPPARMTPTTPTDPTEKAAAGETRDLKLPEFPNKCRVYVPASHEAGQLQAAIVWLQAPAEAKPDDIIGEWQPACDRDGIVLIIPSPAGKDQWERPEIEYLRRLSERVIAQYKLDPNRMVVYGQGKGGTIAWPLALSSRDIFHGIATSATPLPRPVRVPANEPSQRLAIFAALPASKESAAPISIGLRKFADAGYNVATITTASSNGQLSDDERNQLARWIDTLDRF